MTQAERDRLVVLKKTRKGLLTQREATQELEVSERQVRRMLQGRIIIPIQYIRAVNGGRTETSCHCDHRLGQCAVFSGTVQS